MAAWLAADIRSAGDVFSDPAVARLSIRAPLSTLFERGIEDDSFKVPATVEFAPPGEAVAARLSVRGNTSKQDCEFPKLNVHFQDGHGPLEGLHALKVNTHCGEGPDDRLTPKYGRLANETSPWREGLVYALLDAAGIRTPRTRPARITYVDTSRRDAASLTRNALLVEDDDDIKQRLDAKRKLDHTEFTTAIHMFDADDTARLAFAEAMVGNFDWCLRMTPHDPYRCDDSKGLWNLLALETDDGLVPVAEDFDLSGIVTGRHIWFGDVFSAAFGGGAIQTEVIAQVQRTRTLFDRTRLDRVRAEFLAHRPRLYALVASAPVDAHGRQLARAYLDAFYRAIGTDEAFYRPVIARWGVRLYADSGATREACGAGDTVPPGTPVDVVGRNGRMAQVRLLDALWRWAPPHECTAVHRGPVWVEAAAISADFPARPE